MRRVYLILSVLLLLTTGGFGASVSPVSAQGSSNGTKMCQKGGWKTLQGSNGQTFANQGECVSAAAHGEALESIPTTPTPVILGSAYYNEEAGGCHATFSFHYLVPGTHYWMIAADEHGNVIDTFDTTFDPDVHGEYLVWPVQSTLPAGEGEAMHAELYDSANLDTRIATHRGIAC